MDEKTTRSLSRVLENMDDQKAAGDFVSNQNNDDPGTFCDYLAMKIREKDLDRAQVIKRSGISSNYVYQILSGDRANPGRDKIIALCVASEMTYKETQKALEIAGLAPLYPRDERDVRIAIAINSNLNEALELNILLDQYGLDPLDI